MDELWRILCSDDCWCYRRSIIILLLSSIIQVKPKSYHFNLCSKLSDCIFISFLLKTMNQGIVTQTELEKIEKPEKFGIIINSNQYEVTLSTEQRKLLMYSGLALVGFFVVRYLVKSAVRSI